MTTYLVYITYTTTKCGCVKADSLNAAFNKAVSVYGSNICVLDTNSGVCLYNC